MKEGINKYMAGERRKTKNNNKRKEVPYSDAIAIYIIQHNIHYFHYLDIPSILKLL
jgi:hypothetical protein